MILAIVCASQSTLSKLVLAAMATPLAAIAELAVVAVIPPPSRSRPPSLPYSKHAALGAASRSSTKVKHATSQALILPSTSAFPQMSPGFGPLVVPAFSGLFCHLPPACLLLACGFPQTFPQTFPGLSPGFHLDFRSRHHHSLLRRHIPCPASTDPVPDRSV